MKRLTNHSMLLCALLLAPAAAAQTPPLYSLTYIPVPEDWTTSEACGLNDAGDVVGYMQGAGNPHAFLCSGGVVTDIHHLDHGSVAYGINNSGQICGFSHNDKAGWDHAFLYSNGVMMNLGTLGGLNSRAYGINDAGQVVGYAEDPKSISRAFLYSGGVMKDIGTLPKYDAGAAFGINATAEICGFSRQLKGPIDHAGLFSAHGDWTDLGTLGGVNSQAYGINDFTQVVGSSDLMATSHGFVWTPGATDGVPGNPQMRVLGTFGGDRSRANDINNSGEAVGDADTVLKVEHTHAFLYEYSINTMYDLNDLLDVPLEDAWVSDAFAINESGWIVGTAIDRLTGGRHAVLFTPVTNMPPECGQAVPSVGELWPANHKMVPVSIFGVTDPDGDEVTIQILDVRQDEPIDGLGDGDTAPDAAAQGGTVLLRAERSGNGNGRVYHITFMADDGNGGICDGEVIVCVPHDRDKNGPTCVDEGALYSSLR